MIPIELELVFCRYRVLRATDKHLFIHYNSNIFWICEPNQDNFSTEYGNSDHKENWLCCQFCISRPHPFCGSRAYENESCREFWPTEYKNIGLLTWETRCKYPIWWTVLRIAVLCKSVLNNYSINCFIIL